MLAKRLRKNQDGADAIVGAGARAAGGDEDTQNGATTVVEAG